MIIIELKKLVKEGVIIFFVLFVLFAAMVTTDKESYLAQPLELSLILFSSFIGWSMFERERQEGAMEYLLSLPVSRSKLFLIKFIPRTVFIIFILVLYYFIYGQFETYFFLTFFKFSLFFLSIYLVSVSFSLSIKSFLGTFFFAIFLNISLFFLIKYLDWSRDESTIAIQAALSLLVIPILFFILFYKFDIKPVSYFNIKFIPSLVLTVFLLFGITYITTGVEWAHCHLTADGHILKVSRKKTALIKRDNQKFVYKKRIEPIFEDNGMLYAGLRQGRMPPALLVRLNLETGKVEEIYQAEAGWWFHTFSKSAVKAGEQMYFLLTSENHSKYRIAGPVEGGVRTIDIKADFFVNEYIHLFHGVVDNPLQFFVFTESKDRPSRAFRIFENGESEFLFEADAICVYNNRLVKFTHTEIAVYEVGEKIRRVFQRQGEIRVLKRRFDKLVPQKPLLKVDNVVYLFDIEAETFTRVNMKGIHYDYTVSAEEKVLHIVFVNGPEISFSEFIEGRLRPGKVWYSKIDPGELRIISVFSSGVSVNSKKNNEIFLFDEDE